ncbi:hypothetical protein PGB90_009374 [Kerria lacca]
MKNISEKMSLTDELKLKGIQSICGEQEKRYRRKYMDHFFSVIRAHQIVTKSLRLVRPYFEVFFTFGLFGATFADFTAFCVMLSPDMSIYLKVKGIILFVNTNVIFFNFCSIEDLFQEMEEMLSLSIYSAAWYNIPPKERKVIHIFLSQSQYPVRLYGLKIFPFTASLFLSSLKLMYSYANFFIEVQQ